MLGSCIGVAVLAIVYEGLKVLREYIGVKSRREVTYCVNDQNQVGTDKGKELTNDSTTAGCPGEQPYKQYVP